MTATVTLHFEVNGQSVSVEAQPDEMLAGVLRQRLGLTGTKVGCGESECGTCTVLVDGAPVLACNYPAVRAIGRRVRTIEGVGCDGHLHPIQEAFVRFGAIQCGFCTPGMIMSGVALLEQSPDPSEAEIRHALKGNLCRCGSYPAIIRAIRAAAKAMRTGEPLAAPQDPAAASTHSVGKQVPRPDAVAKATGTARYTDDYAFPGMLWGAAKRALQPHAILRGLDVDRGRNLPGVCAVLTARDIPGEHHHGILTRDWPVLVGVGERVRTVGDAVAIVAAETHAALAEALASIEVEYDTLPPVTDPVQALQPNAAQIHDGGNLLDHIQVRRGDPAGAFALADVVVERVYQTPAYDHAFLEPECSIAVPTSDGRLEVYVGSQIPYADRAQIAACLGVEDEVIRVIGTTIGGGFGGKEDIAGQIHAALLARATGHPVKILYDRHESLIAHPKRHATQIRVKMGALRDGHLVAAETELFGDTGAYASLGRGVMTRATTHSTGPYAIPHVQADCHAMYTNNPPAGAFRGFGVTQSCFAVESAMDELAEQLGMDPIALRRINALRVGETTSTGQTLTESVGLLECIRQVESELRRQAAGGDPFAPRPVPGAPNRCRAWGFAIAFKNVGLGGGAPDRAEAEVELMPDGVVEVRTSSAEIGQGLLTVLQMIAAEELGLPLEGVRVLLSDTDLTPDGGPTTASRLTVVAGNAVRHAAAALRQEMLSVLSEALDMVPDSIHLEGGEAVSGERRMALERLAALMAAEGRLACARYIYQAPETLPLGHGGDMHIAFGFAAQAAEVEVDLETGEVRVLNIITANDVGRALNPLGLQGQVEGGVVMGLGTALTEEFILDAGVPFTDRLARYRIPSILCLPTITSFVIEAPTRVGPFGAKGIGEITCIPTAPAITNAIAHACGVRLRRLPVDQDDLLRQLMAGAAAAGHSAGDGGH
jgi:selenium-dependent xanthine dehydrogenase